MKKKVTANNPDALIAAVKESELFTCEEKAFGLKVRYNGIFTAMGSLNIRLFKVNEKELCVTLSANMLMKLVTFAVTAFFWAVGTAALMNASGKTAAIIISFAAPIIMWILDIVYIKLMSKMIIKDIEGIEEKAYDVGV